MPHKTIYQTEKWWKEQEALNKTRYEIMNETGLNDRTIRNYIKKFNLKLRKENLYEHVKRLYSIIIMDSGCWECNKCEDNKDGYRSIKYEEYNGRLHRAMYEFFNKTKIPNNLVAMHICDNPKCFNPEHIKIGTNLDNIQDMVNKKRHCFGDKNSLSKLKNEDAIFIRKLSKMEYNRTELAKKFNVTKTTISNIRNNRTYKNI